MTEAQAGGRKGSATADHLMRLKETRWQTILTIKNKKKDAYIAFLDVKKPYDKAWLDAILHVLDKQGTENETWKIIRELSKNLTANIETKHGKTREIKIKDSIRQGGVLSVTQYALLMDEINKELIKQKVGITVDNINEPVGCLLWMDDVALIAENPEILQKMLDVTNDIACRYHIEFGTQKSKIIKIGRKNTEVEVKLGEQILEYCETYKYLGETINNKMNLTQHIAGTRQKTEAAYQTILNIMGDKHFQSIEMQTAWKLLETCIQPIITYGGEHGNQIKKSPSQTRALLEISKDIQEITFPCVLQLRYT